MNNVDFAIEFTLNSLALDGIKADIETTKQVFKNGIVFNYTGDVTSITNINNHSLCFKLLAAKLDIKEPLDTELLKEMHQVLTAGVAGDTMYIENDERPGSFKKKLCKAGSAYPQHVQSELDSFMLELKDYAKKDTMKVAAYIHVKLNKLYPFALGNNLVNRMFTNYYFLLKDKQPIIFFAEDKEQYQRAFEIYEREENLKPMAQFFMEETIKTMHLL